MQQARRSSKHEATESACRYNTAGPTSKAAKPKQALRKIPIAGRASPDHCAAAGRVGRLWGGDKI